MGESSSYAIETSPLSDATDVPTTDAHERPKLDESERLRLDEAAGRAIEEELEAMRQPGASA